MEKDSILSHDEKEWARIILDASISWNSERFTSQEKERRIIENAVAFQWLRENTSEAERRNSYENFMVIIREKQLEIEKTGNNIEQAEEAYRRALGLEMDPLPPEFNF